MPAIDLPFFGTLVLCITFVMAAYTLTVSVGAGRGRPHLLPAARLGTYATCAFIFLAICILAYAFQTHDFRIRYVARYSDRSMPWWYLLTSLWGGQDGSLLWWTFLLSGYTVAVIRWLRGRYQELQPWIYATLMSIFLFFLILMLFTADPFTTQLRSVPPDGEGLNPLLQNYWMVIHPPSLYMGFVGWSVPFAIVIAALITGRLGTEWIKAARVWAMIAWTFLSVGLLLGCLWSYEELGWGGYWAWDPVENASFMPWLVGTAYLHSVLIQERYQMMKVWNVFLLCLTFIMTIFGTFLTRSGLIASVHSFARSDIGQYFVYYLVFLIVGVFALIIWRLPKLRAQHEIKSLVSREFAFLLNNWMFVGMMVFVLLATTFPLLSQWLRDEEVTVGPSFYNKWMVPFGLVLLFLAGLGPLISWRKATGANLRKALFKPLVIAVLVACLQVVFGNAIGLPAVVESDAIYETMTGRVLAVIHSFAPVTSFAVCAFVLASIFQEFFRGARVRVRKGESYFTAIARLVRRAPRRYGGYIVHAGVVLMFVGFTGAAYDTEHEAALVPGGTMDVGEETVRYDNPRSEVDPNKRMVFTDMAILDDEGNTESKVSPAKFIYRTHPEMPTTEVAIQSHLDKDIYVIMSTLDPKTKRATFRVVVRPLVAWIWIGGLVLLFGCIVSMWPSAKDFAQTGSKRPRGRFRFSSMVILIAVLAFGSTFASIAFAQNDSSSSLHAGSVVIHDPVERKLFSRLLCQCGDCARLQLDSCGCSWAEDMRAEVRGRLADGETPKQVQTSYRAKFGAKAISIPTDKGLDRAMWAVPLGSMFVAFFVLFFLGRRWRNAGLASSELSTRETVPGDDSNYDGRLEDELNRLGDDA